MKIGWTTENDGWAFKNLTSNLVKELNEFKHIEGADISDANIPIHWCPFSLQRAPDCIKQRSILHLEGHRWWTGE